MRKGHGAIVVSAIFAILGSAKLVEAGSLAASKASSVLTVNNVGGGGCPYGSFTGAAIDQVVNPDGTTSALSIPAGEVFVITEATITATDGVAGNHVSLALQLGTLSASNYVALQHGTAEGGGTYHASFTFPSGVVVSPGTTICPEGLDFGTVTELTMLVVVHGFRAKDK